MPFKNPHPLYDVWLSMKGRCRNPNFRQWNDYGGRGIKICDRWLSSFHAFVEDMGPRPDGYSLDRIDNDGDYTPENCRWASRKEQQRNRRAAVFVTVEGKSYRAIELAEIAGSKTDTIVERARRGLSYEEVVSTERLHSTRVPKEAISARKKKCRNRTHCAKGHVFDAANTYLTKDGYKRCRTCHREKIDRYRKMAAP